MRLWPRCGLLAFWAMAIIEGQAEVIWKEMQEDIEQHTLLRVNFDDGTADPSINRCRAKGGISDQYAKPEYVEGIRGKALSCAGPFRHVRYNIHALGEQGTINYWLRNDGVNVPVTQFCAWSEDVGARLYRYFDNSWIIIEGKGRERTFFDPAGTVGPGWNMVTIRWTRSSMASYLNGRPEIKRDAFPFITGIRTLVLGNDWANHTDYAVDEWSVFDRSLSDSEIAFLYHATGQVCTDPLVFIPGAAEGAAPSLDGKISEEEWAAAARLTGLIADAGIPAAVPSTFWLVHDGRTLYVAYRGPVHESARNDPQGQLLHGFLEARETQRDAAVDQEDAVGIEISPEFPLGERFLLWVNARGTRYDARLKTQPSGPSTADTTLTAASSEEVAGEEEEVQEELEEGEEEGKQAERGPRPDKGWNPDWQVSMTDNPDRGWEVEMAIPLDDILGKPKGASPGTEPSPPLGLNLYRSWKKLAQGRDAWAWGRYLPSAKLLMASGSLGRAVLAQPSNPLFRLRQSLGPADQKFEMQAEVLNPSREEMQLELTLRTNAALLRLPQTVTLKPGQSHTISERQILNDPSANRVCLSVSQHSKDGLRPVAQFSMPFIQRQKMEVVLKHYPSAKYLGIVLDLSLFRERPLAEFQAEVELLRGDERMALAKAGEFSDYSATLGMDLVDVPPGDYVVLSLIRARDSVLEINRQGFRILPPPEWLGNAIGLSEEVPPPYEPIRVQGSRIEVWGRAYDFSDALFPRQITAQGQALLAGPVQLEVTGDAGNRHVFSPGTGLASLRHSPSRAEWTGGADQGEYGIHVTGWLEYDGFLWTTFELTGKPGAKIRGVKLEIPLRKEWATLVNNYNYGLQGTGAVPEKGMERSQEPIWLGNETGGLQWLTDYSSPWFVKGQSVKVVKQADRTTLEIHFVDEEVELARPLGWSFGLIATPVRPPPRQPIDNLQALADMHPVTWGYGNFNPHKTDWGNPLAWPDGVYGHGFRRDHANRFFPEGRESDSGPYIMFEVCAAGANSEPGRRMREILDYWFYEWANDGKARWRPGLTGVQVSPNSKSWQDFFLWQHEQLYRRNRFTGLYFDVSMPHFGDNLRAGLGYPRPDGSVAPALSLLGARSIAKRLYTMLRTREPKGQIGYHMSGMINGALIGFCERIIDGENFYSLLNESKPENYHVLSLPAFRAEYMGTNFGPITSWLPQARRRFDESTHGKSMKDLFKDADRETRWIYGIVLLHNSDLWASYVPGEATELIEALQRYELSNSRYHFLPYWSQQVVQALPETLQGRPVPEQQEKGQPHDAADDSKPAGENLVCSVYREMEGERALVVVFNNTDLSGKVRLQVDWPGLGLEAGKARVQNETQGPSAKLEGGAIGIHVASRDVHLIGINGPPKPKKEVPLPSDMEKPAEVDEDADEEEESKLPDARSSIKIR